MIGQQDDDAGLTHGAYGLRRLTRVSGTWLDIGDARFEIREKDLPENLKHLAPYLPQLLRYIRGDVYLNRTILGSFNGHVLVTPMGEKPPALKPKPQRPGEPDNKDTSLSEEDF